MKKRIIHFFVLSCKKATLLMEKQFQGSLSPLERMQMKMHLSICKDCTCYREKSRFLDSCIEKSTANFQADFSNEEIEVFKTRMKIVLHESAKRSECK